MKNTNSSGALLFAIITALVLSLITSTLIMLTTNQYKIIDNEVDRIRAYYRAQAGMEYAVYQAYSNTNWLPPVNGNRNYINVAVPGGNVNIFIVQNSNAISPYNIRINAAY